MQIGAAVEAVEGANGQVSGFSYSLDYPLFIRFPSGVVVTIWAPDSVWAPSSSFVAFLPPTPRESLRSLSTPLMIIMSLAVVGARVISVTFGGTLSASWLDPVWICLSPGFWLHGAVDVWLTRILLVSRDAVESRLSDIPSFDWLLRTCATTFEAVRKTSRLAKRAWPRTPLLG